MGVVTAERLNDFMSSPEWTVEQRDAVQDVLDGLESSLESSLFGAWITPRPTAEVASILRSGLVATRQPVHTVKKVDGVVVDADHPLAAPWVVSGNRLRNLLTGVSAPALAFDLSAPNMWPASRPSSGSVIGHVTVEYDGGWGADPALVLAILRKARNWARNWLEDTVRIRDADSEQAPPLLEEWTEPELKALGRYRNLTAVRSSR